ncbi:hypothetical protein HON88_05995, partial [Candidatus Woesearchaeota archaeon]|nr:hypothetical protein [Candidatus Woesearchaeota archaeon]
MKYKTILLLILIVLTFGCTKKVIEQEVDVYKPSDIIGNNELIGKDVIVEGIIAPNTIVCMA